MATKLTKSKAIEDAIVLDATETIATELEKLPEDTRLGATLTVRDIRAEAAEFRRNRIHGGGAMRLEDVYVTGKLIVEDNELGDDRKH